MSVRDGPDEEPDAPREPSPADRSVPEGRDGAPDRSRELPAADSSPERQQSETPDDPRTRSEAWADLRQQAESDWRPRKFDAPRAELAKFDLERAGLPSMSYEEADKYIDEHRGARPWLAMTDQASPEARRIIAALDAAGGHAHIRHEGWVSEEANMRRVTHLADPAQLNPEKRSLGIDGLRQNDQPHSCRGAASRITDPDAFATAFARGAEHPAVREALGQAFDPDGRPDAVRVPIADLLGPDGHRYCTGWRLSPVDGTMKAARANRDAWISATAEGREPDVPEPRAVPVSTYEGGEILFAFARNDSGRRYEVTTMYSRPA
jgi:hypothetical protein